MSRRRTRGRRCVALAASSVATLADERSRGTGERCLQRIASVCYAFFFGFDIRTQRVERVSLDFPLDNHSCAGVSGFSMVNHELHNFLWMDHEKTKNYASIV